MEFELDKEMDSLLRHEARRGLFVADAPGDHLDADEISAFAENALPQNARMRATGHLADCDRCRKSLANLIQLNSEAESEIIHTNEGRVVTVKDEIPWFRRLFAFPKITYALTAMLLMFTGAIAFVALRSLNEQNATVAQLEPQAEKKTDMDSVASNTEAKLTESSSSNAPANFASNSAANAAPSNASTSANAPADSTQADPLQRAKEQSPIEPNVKGPMPTPLLDDGIADKSGLKDLKTEAPAVSAPATKPQATSGKDDEVALAKPAEEKNRDVLSESQNAGRQNDYATGSVEQNQAQNRSMSPDTQNSKRVPAPAPAPRAVTRAQNETAKTKEEDRGRSDASPSGGERAEPKKKAAPETRSVGGKTFKNVSGVWTDTAYSGGGTKSVRRGSDDYKKLDGGLQSIGNSLGGTVIVVWGGRAYRIQ